MNINVTFQQSDGVASLEIPREHLEAIAQDIAETGLSDPQWSKQASYSITLAYEWRQTPLTIVVKKHEDSFNLVFMLTAEVHQMGFREKDNRD